MKPFLMTIGAAAVAMVCMGGPVFADPAGGSLVTVNPSNAAGEDHDTLPVIRMPSAPKAPSAPSVMRTAAQSAHIQWCQTHYKTYRTSDDTFQPLKGPRKLCVSPANG